MYRICLFLLLFTLAFHSLFSQQVLQNYIREGMENNLVLRERNLQLDQSLLMLKTAKSYYLPSVDFAASYSLADGGRSIDLPLGDLLNGVYSTLNNLTEMQQFPQLENTREQFLANNFYDARVRISYPLLNPDIYYNKAVSQQAVKMGEYEVEIYQAQLTEDIKHAYYNYGLATTSVAILENALELVQQNLKVNESLLRNGKGLHAQVLRAESELENVKAQLLEAEKKRENAQFYFNFLLNRESETPIILEELPLDAMEVDLSSLSTLSERSEIGQLNTAIGLKEIQVKSKKAYSIPRLNTFLDLGSQGFDFAFDPQSQYYLFGLQLTFPIFQGNRNQLAIRYAQMEMEQLENNKSLLKNNLELSAKIAMNNCATAMATLESSKTNLSSATAYFSLIEKGYKEGTNTLIEFMDARNQLTQARLQVSISEYTVLSSLATLKREFTLSNIY